MFPIYRAEWTRTTTLPDTVIVSAFGADHSPPSVLWFGEVDTGRSRKLLQGEGVDPFRCVVSR